MCEAKRIWEAHDAGPEYQDQLGLATSRLASCREIAEDAEVVA